MEEEDFHVEPPRGGVTADEIRSAITKVVTPGRPPIPQALSRLGEGFRRFFAGVGRALRPTCIPSGAGESPPPSADSTQPVWQTVTPCRKSNSAVLARLQPLPIRGKLMALVQFENSEAPFLAVEGVKWLAGGAGGPQDGWPGAGKSVTKTRARD